MKIQHVLVALALCGCSNSESTSSPTTDGTPFEAHCSEPIPAFTLGEKSNPTKEQQMALCACIWKNLGSWERRVSKKITQGKESEVSEMYIRAFASRFGSAIEKCGGMKL